MKEDHSKRDFSILFVFLLLFSSALAVRSLPSKGYHNILIGALTTGTIFNLLSFISVSVAAIQRKRSSGSAFVSLVCYFWFFIASNYVLISIHETKWQWIVLLKPVDALLLLGIIYLCNFPARFQPPPHH